MSYSNNRSRGGQRSFNRSNRSRGGSRGGPRKFNRFQKQPLNPMMFVKAAEPIEDSAYEAQHTFKDFDLSPQLAGNIEKKGYVNPTPIQDQAIKPLMEGKDLIGIANTGTGKTAAFLIPLADKILKNPSEKVLIVAPTRELAMQIKDELRTFTLGTPVYSTLIIGGASMRNQAEGLKRNPNFVIGTPGRIKDLSERRTLRLQDYTNVVLDEVDRMLDMGFIRDMREIIGGLSPERQSLFFSATMPDNTKEIANSFLKNPVTVSVKTGTTAKNVEQNIVRVNGGDKVELLHKLLISQEAEKVLVFGRTKWGINKLEKNLVERGFKVASIHGNKTQGQRQRALTQLKTNNVQILLATDVASRGLDIDDITHVINFDAPESYEDYVHRIGRTGRAGKTGIALTFVD